MIYDAPDSFFCRSLKIKEGSMEFEHVYEGVTMYSEELSCIGRIFKDKKSIGRTLAILSLSARAQVANFWHRRAVDKVLDELNDEDRALLGGNRNVLEEGTRKILCALLPRVEPLFAEPIHEMLRKMLNTSMPLREGIFSWDYQVVSYLRDHSKGKQATALADAIEKRAKDEAKAFDNASKTGEKYNGEHMLWLYHSESLPDLIKQISLVVWHDVLKPRLKEERARRLKVPSPSLPTGLAKVSALTPSARVIRSVDGRMEIEDASGYLSYPTPLAMTSAARQVLRSQKSPDLLAPLVVYLAREAHRQWLIGERSAHIVVIPLGRNELHRLFGISRLRFADVRDALNFLCELRLGGESGSPACVNSWYTEKIPGSKGGPRRSVAIVNVGDPLAPQALERCYKNMGIEIPPSERWYSPVFDTQLAPVIGHKQTYTAQRIAYALSLGLHLIDRREEYATIGITLHEESTRHHLVSTGLRHEKFSGLADSTIDSWIDNQIFREVAPGARRYRLGAGYEDAHEMIMLAAQRSKTGRERRNQKNNIKSNN